MKYTWNELCNIFLTNSNRKPCESDTAPTQHNTFHYQYGCGDTFYACISLDRVARLKKKIIMHLWYCSGGQAKCGGGPYPARGP